LAQTGTIVLTPDQIKWEPAKGLPADWKTAILAGSPDKKGPYGERIKLPPNAAVPPHAHPNTENITVLSGSFGVGEGIPLSPTAVLILITRTVSTRDGESARIRLSPTGWRYA